MPRDGQPKDGPSSRDGKPKDNRLGTILVSSEHKTHVAGSPSVALRPRAASPGLPGPWSPDRAPRLLLSSAHIPVAGFLHPEREFLEVNRDVIDALEGDDFDAVSFPFLAFEGVYIDHEGIGGSFILGE